MSKTKAFVHLHLMSLSLAIIVMAANSPVVAQSILDYGTPAGLAPGAPAGSYALSDVENIHLFSGNLNFTLPLLKVGGRGEAQSSIMLPIESHWTNFRFFQNPDGTYMNATPMYNYHSEWGFTLGPNYGPGELRGRRRVYNREGDWGTTGFTPYDGITRLVFIAPGGTQFELRDTLTGGAPQLSAAVPPPSQGQYASRGTIFVSADGTTATFISETVITDGPNPLPSGYLSMKDGTRYRIDEGLVSWIRDRNGNQLTYTYTDRRVTLIKDSLGRETTIEYGVNDVAPYGLCDRITFPGFGGQPRTIRVSYSTLGNALAGGFTLQTKNQLFPPLNPDYVTNTGGNVIFDTNVISSVWLPDDGVTTRRYRFFYNSYAELAQAELPTGIAYEYDWEHAEQQFYNGYYSELFRRVKERRVISGSAVELKSTYSYIYPVVTVDHFGSEPTSERISRERHFFYGSPFPVPYYLVRRSVYNEPAWNQGKEYQTDLLAADGTTLLQRHMSTWQQSAPVNWWTCPQSPPPCTQANAPPNDPRLVYNVAITFENGEALAALKKLEYDDNGHTDRTYFSHLNIKRSKSYHYKALDLNTAQTASAETIASLFSDGDLASVSETDYSYDSDYKTRGILGLATETRVLNPTDLQDVLARSQLVYDETAYFDNNYITTNWENPNSNLRGNVTTTKTWSGETVSWITSHAMFDNFGNVRRVWDTSGDPTRFIETEYDSAYKYSYPTKTKAPAPDPTGVHGMTEGSETTRTYDFNTGLRLTVTDANGQSAIIEYDEHLRPKKIIPPAGGAVSETIYNDTPGNFWVKSRQQIDESSWAESTTFFDNLGRAYKTRAKDLQGDVVSEVKFDNFGRVEKTSNPYRLNAAGQPSETVYWSKVRYDDRSRIVETFAPAPEGQTGVSLGTVEFGISNLQGLIGTYTIAKDASGRKSRTISGTYGLMRVDEATAKGGTADQDLGTLSNPTQPTFYSYNIKGELVKITQGNPSQPTQPIQYRYFMYDSLGRLMRVRQPEQTPNPSLATTGNPDNNQWTAAYTYDIFGNVVSMTDAKNATITNFYDKAGRTVKRTYSDGTPEVEYFYDGKGLPSTPQFSRGALTKVTSSVSEDRFTSFDNHGRLLASQQITDGQVYNFGYKYNLSGGLIEETYPSGRIVRNFLDSDGGLNAVTSKAGNGFTKRVASDFDYSPTGNIKKMKLGNGLWETAVFDELHQLKQVGLGTTQTNNDLFKTDYEYGELNDERTEVDTTKNIGMIARTTTTVPTTSFVQTFKYDEINRLKEARETTSGQQNWIQTFGYDRFGNRTQFSQTVGTMQLPINNITHPTINQADNRFTTGQGYVYDFNGNLIQDAQNRRFTFNGDDRQTEVRDLNIPITPENPDANVIGRYSYDGSGARVKKVTATETTVFVYDAGGALAAEYSTETPPQEPTTSYLTTDHLGSPRVITDRGGTVISRRDFMPFGEELSVGVGNRTEALKYSTSGTDQIRKRFTGYEKDDETDLDFAEARMYQNRHGRFTAPDPLLASAYAPNPQTLNRYTYTSNNPVNHIDPSGLAWCRNSLGGTRFVGVGVQCSQEDGEDVTNAIVGIIAGDWSKEKAKVGDTVLLNSDGSVTVLNTPEARALALGNSVVNESVEVRGETAGGAASEAPLLATEGGGVSGTFMPRDLLPLPCSPNGPCGSYTPPAVDLTTGASADEILSAVEDLSAVIGQIPVVGEPVDIFIGGGASLLRGNYDGAVLSVISAIPGPLGNAAGITKLGKKGVEAASDIGRKAPSLPDKTIVKQDGVTIDHNYRDNDHAPAHAHVTGGGTKTRIGANGKPLKGDPELSGRQSSVVKQNKSRIRRDINKIRKWLRREKWGK